MKTHSLLHTVVLCTTFKTASVTVQSKGYFFLPLVLSGKSNCLYCNLQCLSNLKVTALFQISERKSSENGPRYHTILFTEIPSMTLSFQIRVVLIIHFLDLGGGCADSDV